MSGETSAVASHARVVVIGGGIAGCSVAYHLTKLGWRDVLLLERRDVSCGTTWHEAVSDFPRAGRAHLVKLGTDYGEPMPLGRCWK